MIYVVFFDDGSFYKGYFNEQEADSVAEAISGVVVSLTITSDNRVV